MNVKAVTTTDSQVSAQIAATTPSSQANSSEKQDSFVSALDQRLKSEDPVEREAAMRRQLSRSIRRSTGTDTQGSVSEEALFAGMVGMQLLESKGRDVYEQYADRVRALTSGSDPQEKSFEVAAKKVLKEIQDSSKVPQAKVDTMYSTAFASSQLDTNTNALYDSLGGKGDKTISVTTFSSALDSGIAALLKIDSGAEAAPKRNVNETPYKQGGKKK